MPYGKTPPPPLRIFAGQRRVTSCVMGCLAAAVSQGPTVWVFHRVFPSQFGRCPALPAVPRGNAPQIGHRVMGAG